MSIIKKDSTYNTSNDNRPTRQIKYIRPAGQTDIPVYSQASAYVETVGSQRTLLKGRSGTPSHKIVIERFKPSYTIPEEPPIMSAPTPQPSMAMLTEELSDMRRQKIREMDHELERLRFQKQNQMEREIQSAREEGFQDGFNEGKEEGLASLRDAITTYLNTSNAMSQEKVKVMKQVEKDVIELSVQIAEKIIGKELSMNPETIVDIVNDGIRKVTDKDTVTIKVSPDDFDYVVSKKELFQQQMPDIKNIVILRDPRMVAGGCKIETSLGYIDSSVSTKLSAIKQAFFDTYRDLHGA